MKFEHFSKKVNKVLSKSEIKKAEDEALIKVVKEQRKTIDWLKSHPWELIFTWIKKRREGK